MATPTESIPGDESPRLIRLTDEQLLTMARRYLVPAGGEFHIPPGMVILTDAGLLEALRDVAGRGWRPGDSWRDVMSARMRRLAVLCRIPPTDPELASIARTVEAWAREIDRLELPATNARKFGETLTDDQLATIVDTGGANVFEGDVARIAAELLARRAGGSHG
jgi:hypothetical protein